MDLYQLKVFKTVSDSGSIRVAANKLHKTQPALSIAIKKLEEEIGFQLFNRNTYKLTLTKQGRNFYQRARQLIRLQQRLASYCEHIKQGFEPEIHIAIEDIYQNDSLIEKLRPVQRQHWDTEIHFRSEDRLNGLDLLIENQVDLAITPWLPNFVEYGDLLSHPIGSLNLINVISDKIVQEIAFIPSTIEQLAEIPQILPERFALKLDESKLIPTISHSVIRTNNSHMHRRLLLAGMGWGLATKEWVKDELDQGILHSLAMPELETNFSIEIHIVKRANDTLGKVAQAIWDAIVE